MANSYTEVTLTQAQTTGFTTPSYVESSHLVVKVNDVAVPSTSVGATNKVFGSFTATNALYYIIIEGQTSLSFSEELPSGAKVHIQRSSNQNSRLVDYSDASLLTADTMDRDANQIFFVAQEALDQSSLTNVAASDFYYSQGTEPATNTVGTLWYDTSATPNILKVRSSVGFEAATPIHNTNKYTNSSGISDTTGASSGTYSGLSHITDATFNTSAYFHLNGVKQVSGTLAEVNANTADYHYDSSTNKVYFKPITASDIIVVETYSGSYSQEVTDKEAAALNHRNDAEKLATNAENSQFTLSDGVTTDYSAKHFKALAEAARDAAQTAQGLSESARNDAQTAQGLSESARNASQTAQGLSEGARDASQTAQGLSEGARDTALSHKNLAQEYATKAEDTNITGGTDKSALHYAAKAAASASDAATSESNAASTLANAVTLNTGQTVTGAKVFSANTDFGAGIDVTGVIKGDSLDIDGNATFTSSDTYDQVIIENTSTSTTSAPDLKFRRSGAVGQASNIGVVAFNALNSTPTDFSYANIVVDAVDLTAGSETGKIKFQVADPSDSNNYPVPRLSVDKDGIDVTGTVTADALDIDGAVDVNTSNGNVDFDMGSGTFTITSTNTGDQLLLTNTNTGSGLDGAPDIVLRNLYTNVSEIVDNNILGSLHFGGNTLNVAGDAISGATESFGRILCLSNDVTDGTHDGILDFRVADNGTVATRMQVKPDGINVTGTVTADALTMGDGEKITLGTGGDLEIYHSGSHSIIEDTGTGNLLIKADDLILEDTNGNNFIKGSEGGTVQIWHNAASHATAKLATTATGIDVNGTVTATSIALNGNMETDGNITVQNGHELRFEQTDGTESFSIKTSGTTTNLLEQGGGNLNIKGDAVVICGNNTDFQKITCHDEGGVKISSMVSGDATDSYIRIKTGDQHTGTRFYCGTDETNVRAEVVSAGLNVNGTVTADVLDLSGNTAGANNNPVEVLSLPSNSKIEFDNTFSLQHQIWSGIPYAYIRETGSGGLRIEGASVNVFTNDGSGDAASFDVQRINASAGATGNVKLYYGNETNSANHKFETTSTGVNVVGTVTADSITSAPTTVVTTNGTVPTVAVNKKYIDTYDSGVNAYVLPTGTVGQMITFVNASTQNITLNRNTNSITLEKVIAGSDPANVTDATITVGKSGAVEVVYTGTNTAVIFGSGIS